MRGLVILFLLNTLVISSVYGDDCPKVNSVVTQSRPLLAPSINPLLNFESFTARQEEPFSQGQWIFGMADIFDYQKLSSFQIRHLKKKLSKEKAKIYNNDFLSNFLRGTVTMTGDRIFKGDPSVIIGYDSDSESSPENAVAKFTQKFTAEARVGQAELVELTRMQTLMDLRQNQSQDSIGRLGKVRGIVMGPNMAVESIVFEKAVFVKNSEGGQFVGRDVNDKELRIITPN